MNKELAEQLISDYLWTHDWPEKDVVIFNHVDWPVMTQWTFMGLWFFVTGERP